MENKFELLSVIKAENAFKNRKELYRLLSF